MTDLYLGVDAGGTSTRAVVVRADGTCVGLGQAGSGNPTSAGREAAITALRTAISAAIGTGPAPSSAALAVAGAGDPGHRAALFEALSGLVSGQIVFDNDLLAAYFSGTAEPDGYALVAGTGAAAIRVRDGRVEEVVDGLGWLLGDTGSGFWIGREVARAALADLEERKGAATALSGLLLDQLGITDTDERLDGRRRSVFATTQALYAWPPLRLADLAPLAFAAAPSGDVQASRILEEAVEGLRATLRTVRSPAVSGPVVLGGSVLARQSAFAHRVTDGVVVRDGTLGAAVLALRHAGRPVSPALHARLAQSIAGATEA